MTWIIIGILVGINLAIVAIEIKERVSRWNRIRRKDKNPEIHRFTSNKLYCD